MRGKLVTLWCILVFTAVGLAQQRTVDEGELGKILALMERRLQKIATLRCEWEEVREFLPDPYFKEHWQEEAEKRVRQIPGWRNLPREAIEQNREAYQELFRQLGEGFKTQRVITFEGCGSLVLAKATQHKPFFVAQIFFFTQSHCLLDYGYGQGAVKPYASVKPMNEVEPVLSNLLTRWFFLGGNIVKWGNFRVQSIEQNADIVTLTLMEQGQEKVSPEYRHIVEVRIGRKYEGAPISVLSRHGQIVIRRLEGRNFRKVDDVWLPTIVFDTARQYKVTYRLISVEKMKDPVSVIAQLPKNIVVNDLRLGRDRQVNYPFRGRLPTLEELEKMWQEREKERRYLKARSAAARWLPPIFLIVVGVIWYLRMRGKW
ncbi:MAG: hypothetical protein HZLCBSQH_002276 [Candidatus Fervidibacterota bacterium]